MVFFLVLITALFSACTTQNQNEPTTVHAETEVSLSPAPEMNEKYLSELKYWRKTARFKNYENFNFYFEASATLLSPTMYKAYEKRSIEIFGGTGNIDSNLMQTDFTLILVVDIYSNHRHYIDLEDTKIWQMTLSVLGKSYSPQTIYGYKKGFSMYPYFPPTSDWSQYYVVVYKIPAEVKKTIFSKNLPQNNNHTVVFAMKSGILQAIFSWKIQ